MIAIVWCVSRFTGQARAAPTRQWSEEEEKLFLEGLDLHGRAWVKVGEHIGTRDARSVSSHAQKHFIKLYVDGTPLPAKVLESGAGYTLSGRPLDTSSAAFHAYAGKAIRAGLVPGVSPLSKPAKRSAAADDDDDVAGSGDEGKAVAAVAAPGAPASDVSVSGGGDEGGAGATPAVPADAVVATPTETGSGALAAPVPPGALTTPAGDGDACGRDAGRSASADALVPPAPQPAAGHEAATVTMALPAAATTDAMDTAPIVAASPSNGGNAVDSADAAGSGATADAGAVPSSAAAVDCGNAVDGESAAKAPSASVGKERKQRVKKTGVELDDHGRTEYSRQRWVVPWLVCCQ